MKRVILAQKKNYKRHGRRKQKVHGVEWPYQMEKKQKKMYTPDAKWRQDDKWQQTRELTPITTCLFPTLHCTITPFTGYSHELSKLSSNYLHSTFIKKLFLLFRVLKTGSWGEYLDPREMRMGSGQGSRRDESLLITIDYKVMFWTPMGRIYLKK